MIEEGVVSLMKYQYDKIMNELILIHTIHYYTYKLLSKLEYPFELPALVLKIKQVELLVE